MAVKMRGRTIKGIGASFMNMSDIKKMSVIERLQAMEALWDSLTHENTEIKSPEWHRDILEERKKSMEEGKAKIISLDELKSTLK